MSVVSGHDQITALVEGDQVTATLYATKPLSQYIKKGTDGISPDWTVAANQPVIYAQARSQNTGLRKNIQPGSEGWSYNGQLLTFNATTGACTAPVALVGKFKKTTFNDGDIVQPALQIIGNLASLANTDNDIITFKGNVEIEGVARPMEPSIPIRIEETVGDPYDGYIDATDAGVIDEDTASVVLTAHLTKGGNIVDTGVVYKFHKAILGGWQEIAAQGIADKRTLLASDIDSSAIIRVDFLVDSVVVFSTTRPVYDETDPLVMSLNPSQSQQLRSGESVTYTPSVHRRSTGTKENGYTNYTFTAFAKDNTPITLPASQVTASTCRITHDDVKGIGKGGINLYVSTAN